MKTRLCFLIAATVAVSSHFFAKAEQKEIVICRSGMSSSVHHRAPAQIPIVCLLEDDSALLVTILADLGTISVEIENQTTGEYCQFSIDSLVGATIFPISGSSGNWTIMLTVEAGEKYIGSFSVI